MEEIDKKFHEILKLKGKEKCISCGRIIDRGDVAWNDASNENGTPYSVLQIQCQSCDMEILNIFSWHPLIESFEEFVEVLEHELFY